MRKFLLFLISVVYISGSIYCQNNLAVPTINATDVVFSWDDGGCTAGSYILRYRENGAAWNQNPPITISNTGGTQNHPLSGLNFSTHYNWRIKCGSTGSWVYGPDFTTLGGCAAAVTQTITNFVPDPLTGYMQYSYDTLIITNISSCDVNIRPEFIISHSNSPIQQGNFTIEWKSPIGGWINIPYQINGSGDAYGFWSFPTGDSTGFNLATGGNPQLMRIRVAFMNPNNSPPNGAPFGTYSASWTTLEVDTLGNVIQTLAPSSPVSLTLSDCSGFSIDSISITNSTCNGGANGSAMVFSINGGSGNYSYSWSNGSTSETANGLDSGIYYVLINDLSLGCSDSGSVIITEPDSLSASITGTNSSCNGADDGTLNTIVSGGSGQFDFIWTSHPGLAPIANPNSLAPGTYLLDVLDLVCGDIAQASYTLSEPDLLSYAIINATDNSSCITSICNGSFGLTLSGGNTPYTYSWTNSSSTDSLRTDLCSGSYTITASDANSCNTFTEIGNIADNPFSPNACITGNNISCNGLTDGSAIAKLTNGGCGVISTLSYCASSPGTNDYATIDLVRMIGDGDSIVNNTNGICDTYEDYTTQYATLTPGQTYSIDINLGTCNQVGGTVDSAGIFIDWNLDGDFTDIGEKIVVFSGVQSPSSHTQNITVPNTAASGPTRMRVISQAIIGHPSFPDGSVSPCAVGDFGAVGTYAQPWYGSTEDYTIVVSGSLPATYQWSNGDTTASISGLSTGTYSCIVTDLNGCSATDSIIITEPTTISIIESTTNVSCSGGNDGTATLTISGGTAPYTRDWGANDSLNLSAGINYYTVTDDNGCTDTGSVTITEPTAISVIENTSNVNCFGGNDGTATLTISGGTAPYFENWNGNDSSALAVGIYYYTVTDGIGCIFNDSIEITEPSAQLTLTDSATNVTCNGGTGLATVYISGGTQPYTIFAFGFNITLPSSTYTTPPGMVPAGTYPYSVSDDNGCIETGSITITEPTAISVIENTSNVSCAGGNDGTATLTISGGTSSSGNYTLNWFGENPDSLSVGTYNYEVSDDNGCTETGSVTITEPMAISVIENTSNVNCFGGNDGTATLTISGGTVLVDYTLNWFGENPDSLSVGTYNYEVSDDNGCTNTGSVTITEPGPLWISIDNSTNVTNCSTPNGNVNITVGGGITPYFYLWNNGDTTEDISNLSAGIYTATVTDANGCSAISSDVTISNPNPINWTIDSTNNNGFAISCNGGNDGGIFIATSGGVGTITYSWPILASTNDTVSGLTAGTYTVIATDDANCSDTRNIDIHEPNIISALDFVTQINCNGGFSLFSDSLVISGGVSPYTVNWYGQNPDSLSTGVHYYQIIDDNGCVINDSVSLVTANPLVIIVGNETDVACHGDSTGTAVFLVSGGVPPYSYLWSNGDTNEIASNLVAGTYSCIISDYNNCSVTGTVSVSQPSSELLSSILLINNIACYGDSTGSALITVSGGMYPYDYEWDNGETDSLAINLSVGINICTIIDDNNCELNDTIHITQSPNIIYSDSISNYNGYQIKCNGDSNGLINITVSGGGVPSTQGSAYSYQWMGPNGFTDSSSLIDSLIAGEYSCIISDSLGCEKQDTFLLEEPGSLYTSLDSTYDLECWGYANNPADGFAGITIYGGVPNYTINSTLVSGTLGTIGNPVNSFNFTGHPAGTHFYEITDYNSCSYNDSFTLIHLTDSLFFTSTLSDYNGVNISCKGYSDGWVMIDSILGGQSPYSFNWSNGDSALFIDTLSVGWHTAILTDSFGCIFIENIQITEPNFALDTYLDTFTVSCNGYCDGMLIANSYDGTGPYTFEWYDNLNNIISTNDTADVCSGEFSLIVTDNNGCTNNLTTTISEPLILSINLDSIFNISVNGLSDGAIYISATGGNGSYMSSWIGTNGFTSINGSLSIENLLPGTYQVVIYDVLGCYSDTSTYIITEPPSVAINLDSIHSAFTTTCYDSCDGSITINPILSPSAPFTIYWEGPNGYTSTSSGIDSLCAGNYILYIVSGADSIEFNFTINEPNLLEVDIYTDSILCYSGHAFTTAYAYGGTLPYHWLWSNNTQNISALLDSGNHYVTVTDDHGCTISESITLSQPDSMWFTANTIPPNCHNGADGEISIDNIYNGTSPFLYSINNFITYQMSDVFNNLSSGGYLISIEDSNGCIAIDSLFISNPAPLSVTTLNPISSSDTVDCNGDCNGLVQFNYANQNGTPNTSWEQWSGGNINGNLCPGIYNCIFTDDNGCTTSLNNITIHNAPPIIINSTSSSAPTCKNGNDGWAKVFASGGTGSVGYTWPNLIYPGSGLPSPHNWTVDPVTLIGYAESGDYWCTIIDGNGCKDSINVIVPENNDTFLVEIVYNSSILSLGQVLGNTANPYTYEWNTGESTPTIFPLTNGQYWLIVTDTNSCLSDTAFYNVIGIHSSIEELSDNLLIYPNPTTDILFIDSKNNISKIDIFNHLGEKILSKEIEKHLQLKNYQINLEKFSKGIYHIQITINTQTSNHKIILQ